MIIAQELVFEIATFDGNSGRVGKIGIELAPCAKCEQVSYLISIDQSETEYNPGRICCECILAALQEYARKRGVEVQ